MMTVHVEVMRWSQTNVFLIVNYFIMLYKPRIQKAARGLMKSNNT
jgi:hypothetical protein